MILAAQRACTSSRPPVAPSLAPRVVRATLSSPRSSILSPCTRSQPAWWPERGGARGRHRDFSSRARRSWAAVAVGGAVGGAGHGGGTVDGAAAHLERAAVQVRGESRKRPSRAPAVFASTLAAAPASPRSLSLAGAAASCLEQARISSLGRLALNQLRDARLHATSSCSSTPRRTRLSVPGARGGHAEATQGTTALKVVPCAVHPCRPMLLPHLSLISCRPAGVHGLTLTRHEYPKSTTSSSSSGRATSGRLAPPPSLLLLSLLRLLSPHPTPPRLLRAHCEPLPRLPFQSDEASPRTLFAVLARSLGVTTSSLSDLNGTGRGVRSDSGRVIPGPCAVRHVKRCERETCIRPARPACARPVPCGASHRVER